LLPRLMAEKNNGKGRGLDRTTITTTTTTKDTHTHTLGRKQQQERVGGGRELVWILLGTWPRGNSLKV
jgi:hypothetical protein